MKKILFLSLVFLLPIMEAYSQDCELSSEANKHKIRGEVFMEAATTPQDYGRVADEWKKAIALAPDCPELLYNLAIVYGEIGDFQQAKRYLDKYVALDKSDAAKQDAEILLIKLEAKKEIYEEIEYKIEKKSGKSAYVGVYDVWGLYEVKISDDGEIMLVVPLDNRGNRQTVKGEYNPSDKTVIFHNNYTYYDDEGSYSNSYGDGRPFDTESIPYKKLEYKGGKIYYYHKDVSSQHYRNGRLIGRTKSRDQWHSRGVIEKKAY